MSIIFGFQAEQSLNEHSDLVLKKISLKTSHLENYINWFKTIIKNKQLLRKKLNKMLIFSIILILFGVLFTNGKSFEHLSVQKVQYLN